MGGGALVEASFLIIPHMAYGIMGWDPHCPPIIYHGAPRQPTLTSPNRKDLGLNYYGAPGSQGRGRPLIHEKYKPMSACAGTDQLLLRTHFLCWRACMCPGRNIAIALGAKYKAVQGHSNSG